MVINTVLRLSAFHRSSNIQSEKIGIRINCTRLSLPTAKWIKWEDKNGQYQEVGEHN